MSAEGPCAKRGYDYPEGYAIGYDEWHFHRRVYERYFGLRLPYGCYSVILKQIRAGSALRLGTMPGRPKRVLWLARVHKVGRGNIDLFVVYQPWECRLITVLKPTPAIKEQARKLDIDLTPRSRR